MPEFRLEVNGIERNVALPTLSVQHVVNGPDILEGDVQDDDGSIALILDQVVTLWQTDVSPETVYFEGLLQSKGNNTWTGHGYARLRKITAFDYSVYTTFVDAASETDGTESMATVLQRLVDDHLVDYGVTLHPSQLTGPTLAANAFAGTKANVILNSFSEQTGWVWKIDDQKQLRMWNPATEAAGFNVTATNDTYVHDIATNQLKQRSYNRVFVEGGEGYHTIVNEQHFGDGSATTFLMNAPMHYFEVDYTSTLGFMVGLTLLVVRSGGTTVEYANDQLTAQWTFNRGPEYSLTQVSGAILGPTEYILIPAYAAQYPMRLVADGRGSPPVPPRDLTLKRPLIFNRDGIQAIADQVLAASIGDFERITYPTRRTDIRPGQTQTVNVPEAGVNGSYTATDVRMRYEAGGDTSEFWLDVTAVNAVTARSFWLNLLDRWLTDNQGTASPVSTGSIGSSVPPSSVPPPGSVSGSLIGVRRITSLGAFTYTPSPGTTAVIVELLGAGGGGAGSAATTAGQVSFGRGGGGGGYSRTSLNVGFAGATGSVGSGGAGGGAGGAGTAGGNTTFVSTTGTTYTAGGGTAAGAGGISVGFPLMGAGVQAGGTVTNGDTQQPGEPGHIAMALAVGQVCAGRGGGSMYGAPGGVAALNSGGAGTVNGSAAVGYGAGGGGGLCSGASAASSGGSGADGIVIIWEYR